MSLQYIALFLTAVCGITYGNSICSPTHVCIGHTYCKAINESAGICVCDDHYTTINNDTFCGYERKSSLIALILTIFLDEVFPAGRFYASGGLSNVDSKAEAISLAQMLTSGFAGACIMYAVCLVFTKTESDARKLTTNIISITTFTWWVANIVFFAKQEAYDEYDVALAF